MKGKLLSFVLMMAVLLSGVGVYAASFDFELTTTSVSTCPCSTQEIIGTITNNDNSAHTYEMSSESPWFVITPNSFKVLPGQSKTVYIYMTPTCFEAEAGNYQIKLSAKDDENDVKNRYVDVQVLRCSDVDITIDNKDVSWCKYQDVTVPIEITNRGKVEEVFDLKASKGFLSKEQVILGPGQSETVNLVYSVSKDFETVIVKAVSQNSYAESVESIRFNGLDCYLADLDVLPEEKNVCLGQTAEFEVDVKNIGIKDDEYTLSSNLGNFSENDVFIRADKDKKVTLSVKLDEAGKYPINIRADSSRTGATTSATLNVLECRGLAVVALPKNMDSCNLNIARYLVSVKNVGTYPSKFSISSNIGVLGEEEMFLNPGESKETVLDIDVSQIELDGDNTLKNVTIYVESEDGKIKDMHQSTLNITNCYDAWMASNVRSVDMCVGDSVEVTYLVKNNGLKEDYYVMEISGENDDEEIFTLKPGEEREITMTHSEPLETNVREKTVDVTMTSDNGVVRSLPLTFEIKDKETCYGYDAEIIPEEIRGREYKGYTYRINVKNNGLNEDMYTTQIAGPEWVYIEPKELLLEQGENGDFYLYAAPTEQTKSGEYFILVTITNTEGMTKTLDAKFVFEGENERLFARGTETITTDYEVDVSDELYTVSPEEDVVVPLFYETESGIEREFDLRFGASSFVVQVGDTVIADDSPVLGYNEYKIWSEDKLYTVVVKMEDIDEYRNEYTFRIDSVTVTEHQQVEPSELKEKEGINVLWWILVVLIIVAIIITLYYFFFMDKEEDVETISARDVKETKKMPAPMTSEKPIRCKAKTKDGKRCKRITHNVDGYCDVHREQAVKKQEAPKKGGKKTKKSRKQTQDEIREILEKI